MSRLLRRNLKAVDEDVPVPSEQAIIIRICECCDQPMPLDKFEQRGRPKKNGDQPAIDTVCKYCRKLHAKAVRNYVMQHQQRIDEMQLGLMEALAVEPTEEWTDLPNIGTIAQEVLRPFGGAKGLGLQIASHYLTAPPGGAERGRTHRLLTNLATEASKLGYAKKTMEQMSDEELEEFLKRQERKLIAQSEGTDDDDQEETEEGAETGSA